MAQENGLKLWDNTLGFLLVCIISFLRERGWGEVRVHTTICLHHYLYVYGFLAHLQTGFTTSTIRAYT